MRKKVCYSLGLAALLAGLGAPSIAAADDGDTTDDDSTSTSVNTAGSSQDDIDAPGGPVESGPGAVAPPRLNNEDPADPKVAKLGGAEPQDWPDGTEELTFGGGTVAFIPPRGANFGRDLYVYKNGRPLTGRTLKQLGKPRSVEWIGQEGPQPTPPATPADEASAPQPSQDTETSDAGGAITPINTPGLSQSDPTSGGLVASGPIGSGTIIVDPQVENTNPVDPGLSQSDPTSGGLVASGPIGSGTITVDPQVEDTNPPEPQPQDPGGGGGSGGPTGGSATQPQAPDPSGGGGGGGGGDQGGVLIIQN